MGHTGPDVRGGKVAQRPSHFSFRDWKEVLWRVWNEILTDNLSLIAAGVAFYAMLALFPGIAALISLFGVFADISAIDDNLGMLANILPAEVYNIIAEQISTLTSTSTSALGFASIFSLLVSLWFARNGVAAMMQALNIVYEEREERSLIASTLVTLVLTVTLIGVIIVTIVALVVVPAIVELLPLGPFATAAASFARWPIVLFAVIFGVGALYRYGPDRREPKARWVTWGALIAVLIWLLASVLFSLYVANFAQYNKTYGSLGAIVVLLLWFYIGAFIVLVGAEINAEMEMQTRRDTTVGPDRPMGKRGAYVADHVAHGEDASERDVTDTLQTPKG